jgi:hypothetical protein
MSPLPLALLLAPAPVLADIGPEPTPEEFAAAAEPALMAKLKVKKPPTVEFTWPYKLNAGPAGYYTCGHAAAVHNGRKGKEMWVSAVVTGGRAVDAQWSTMNGMLAWECKNDVRDGKLVAR